MEEGFECFVCHKIFPTKKVNLVNKLLFPDPTCRDCAVRSGRIYGECDYRCDEIAIHWDNFEEEEMDIPPPPPTLIDALSKHKELLGTRTYMWYYLIGLYGSLDRNVTKYSLYEVDSTVEWSRQYVYLIEDIQKRVDEMRCYEMEDVGGYFDF
jgi:hypothetical protein